jgi:hypothetical protein
MRNDCSFGGRSVLKAVSEDEYIYSKSLMALLTGGFFEALGIEAERNREIGPEVVSYDLRCCSVVNLTIDCIA